MVLAACGNIRALLVLVHRGWQAFSFIQLNYFMSVRGYTFFLICMYILAVALAANLAMCIWVSNSFKNNEFGHVW
jgi:hypothetical protein